MKRQDGLLRPSGVVYWSKASNPDKFDTCGWFWFPFAQRIGHYKYGRILLGAYADLRLRMKGIR